MNENSVQATNNSSFMSKAHMIKRGYVPDESPLSYTPFLPNGKICTRSPLINRGYYIRHKAIHDIVQSFMHLDGLQIVSIGCGFDLSFFKYAGITLVECDFAPVVAFKVKKLLETDLLAGRSVIASTADSLDSLTYHLFSCDLRNLKELKQKLSGLAFFDLARPTIIVSECVLTYVDTADQVIAFFAETFPDCAMLLYEQVKPTDAFGAQMISHFKKLNAGIQSIYGYPTVMAQRTRMRSAGFEQAMAFDMGHYWLRHVSASEKKRVDTLEPFDEHEEFFMKLEHYVIAVGVNGQSFDTRLLPCQEFQAKEVSERDALIRAEIVSSSAFDRLCRWGHTVTKLGESLFVFGGYSHSRRLSDGFILSSDESLTAFSELVGGERMYHSACEYMGQIYIFGGRRSPSAPLNDMHCFDPDKKQWSLTSEEGPHLYHHSALVYGTDMFVFGGVGKGGRVSNTLWAFSFESGEWQQLVTKGKMLPRLQRHSTVVFEGKLFIIGGLLDDGRFSEHVYVVDLNNGYLCSMVSGISFISACVVTAASFLPAEFVLLVGGLNLVSGSQLASQNIVKAFNLRTFEFHDCLIPDAATNVHEMWLNHACAAVGNELWIVGGGAIVFSMGSFMQKGLTRLKLSLDWRIQSPLKWVRNSKQITRISVGELSQQDFKSPFIVTEADLGSCKEKWQDAAYLTQILDAETKVSVHVCTSNRLEFSDGKNFEYVVMPWREFIERLFSVDKKEWLYLRSIGINPRKDASDLSKFAPALSKDVTVPVGLPVAAHLAETATTATVQELSVSPKFHSSVLRMSSPGLQVWTHYDMMDNALLQIHGRKFLTLLAPSNFEALKLPAEIHSSSSPIVDLFSPFQDPFGSAPRQDNGVAEHATAFAEAWTDILKPGEMLFIPALWFHNTYTLPDDVGISVNLFWKGLPEELFVKKDLYGNKDLKAAVDAFELVEKAVRALDGCPYRSFYMARLAYLLNEHNKK